MYSRILTCFALSALLIGCDGSKMTKTPDSQFVGKWRLEGHGMLDSVVVSIKKLGPESFEGRVLTRNSNKYVDFFLDSNAVLVNSITRRSNFQFTLTETKLGAQLLGAYDVSTKTEYAAQFLHKDTIVLATMTSENSIKKSELRYVRVK